ncbi:MAG: YhcH/YjgK/YiaL family protein [Candidatus Gastranaerophilales bacterium]|nr:YhcH/YjgK/YiaL family protein [Candidatus Gastranaerophilales bacterium]
MIKDNIKNAETYTDLPERVKIGLKYLAETDFSCMKNGKYEISGDKIFAIVQDYLSKPLKDAKFEAHRKHTDIQYIIEGEEQIGIDDADNFSEETSYDDEKDIIFLKRKQKGSMDFIKLKQKEFAIFTPKDAHAPSIAVDDSNYVKKVVVKVLI